MLIPVNILVCIISLIAAISLFLAPILKIDIGKIARNEEVHNWLYESDSSPLKDLTKNEKLKPIAPALNSIIDGVINDIEGEMVISAKSAYEVLISDEKGDKVLDELFFGDKALITKLINNLVDDLTGIFDNQVTKDAIQEAIVAAMMDKIMDSLGDDANKDLVSGSSHEIVEIFNELGNEGSDPEEVANRIVDKIDELLGEDSHVNDSERQDFVNQIKDLYDDTQEQVGEGGTVDLEAIICVAASKELNLKDINFSDLIKGAAGNGESAVHIKSVRDGNEDEETDSEDSEEGETYPTTYKELLGEMGLDKESKDSLKTEMRTVLNDRVTDMLKGAGIYQFLGYYGYIFYGMLVFIVLWLILFLFSLFHLLARNKRFMMWYVKLLCWVPSLFWLALKLVPIVGEKLGFLNDTTRKIMNIALSGVSSGTWINGLCYVLLWVISIFWAFPIKHKIRKERRHPEDEDEGYGEYDDDYESY